MKLSLVVPCFNEAENVELFRNTVMESFAGCDYEYEIVFVDDGSTDATAHELRKLCKDQKCNAKAVILSRNFGKEAGMYAGLQHATGDYVVIIDADLQDPPHLMDEMYKTLIETDYDCVASCRVDRKGESKIRSAFAHMFLFQSASDCLYCSQSNLHRQSLLLFVRSVRTGRR